MSRLSVWIFTILISIHAQVSHVQAQIPLTNTSMTVYAQVTAVDLLQQGYSVSDILKAIEEARAWLCNPDIPGPTEEYRKILLQLYVELLELGDDNSPIELSAPVRLEILRQAFEPACGAEDALP